MLVLCAPPAGFSLFGSASSPAHFFIVPRSLSGKATTSGPTSLSCSAWLSAANPSSPASARFPATSPPPSNSRPCPGSAATSRPPPPPTPSSGASPPPPPAGPLQPPPGTQKPYEGLRAPLAAWILTPFLLAARHTDLATQVL